MRLNWKPNQKRFLLYFLVIFLINSILWISRIFGNPSLDQILFHLQFSTKLFYGFETGLILNFIKNCILGSAAISYGLSMVEKQRFLKPALRYFPALLAFASLFLANSKFCIAKHFGAEKTEDFIKTNYISPLAEKAQPPHGRPRNLIMIYVESLESSYSNASVFKRNLLAPLDKLPGFSFDRFREVPGTNWTMAGITASQCSLPLKPIALPDGNLQGQLVKYFLPQAFCLGDTLRDLGYRNVFLGGAANRFSGKEKFLSAHGYHEVLGRGHWFRTGRYSKENTNSWGLYDDQLFTEARSKLDELASQSQPFNLTLLTVDTHFPNGYLSPTCRSKGGKTFEDIVECSAQEVASFVQYAEDRGYLKNTDVVILGDHLSMPNAVHEKLSKVKERHIYNKWITKSHMHPNRDEIVHFDIAPTILESLGIHIRDGRYGLGFSAIMKHSKTPKNHRFDDLLTHLSGPSDFYNHLWFPKN